MALKEMKEQTDLRQQIKDSGVKIRFIEVKADIPKTLLYQYLYGVKRLQPEHITRLKKVLKKYKINLVV